MDVLEDIFLFYQVQEDVFHPLETLLLVCKFWSAAASSCRALWSNFTIHISHEPTIKTWNARLPLRLARTGSSILLDITICADIGPLLMFTSEYYGEMLSPLCLQEPINAANVVCPCSGKRESLVASALELLAGEKGEICKRWRSLDLRLGPWRYCIDPLQEDGRATLLRGLTYPTPALKRLVMRNFRVREPPSGSTCRLLPSTPVIDEVEVYHCFVPWHLSMPNICRAKLQQGTERRARASPKVRSLEGSESIRELHLTIGPQSGVRLPSKLPRLTHLTLDGEYLPLNFNQCHMPRLECLAINMGHFGISRKLVLQCPDFPFSQLKKLDFRLQDSTPWPYSLVGLCDSILKILRGAATSLVSFHSIEIVHSIVIKWLWEYQQSLKSHKAPGREIGLFFRQKVTLSTSCSSRELGGHERGEDLEMLAQNWGIVPPSRDWNFLLDELDKESLRVSAK
jgi:hypothetical protein